MTPTIKLNSPSSTSSIASLNCSQKRSRPHKTSTQKNQDCLLLYLPPWRLCTSKIILHRTISNNPLAPHHHAPCLWWPPTTLNYRPQTKTDQCQLGWKHYNSAPWTKHNKTFYSRSTSHQKLQSINKLSMHWKQPQTKTLYLTSPLPQPLWTYLITFHAVHLSHTL